MVLMRRSMAFRLAGIAGLTGLGVLAAGCSSGQPAPVSTAFARAATPTGSWAEPNGDLANTRDADSVISSANVSKLREAWTFKLTGTAAKSLTDDGSLAAAPVVTGGVVYLQDLYANVYAISLATGKLKWEYQVNMAAKSGPGPDGVAVSGGVVYGDSSTAAFALSAATGKVLWNDRDLLTSKQGYFEIQPAVGGGRVYLGSAYGSGPGGGVILALDAATGKQLWSFNTVTGSQPGVQALGLGSGGVWETPLVGSDGSVTFGTGNPYQSVGEAISHPSQQLYTDSAVNLDAATGKLRWYYQAVANDFKDYDLQLSPIAASVHGVPAVISGGKMGYVYAMNSATGALLWKTPVGAHDGHDNDSQLLLEHRLKLTLPYSYEPGALGGILTNMAVADGSVYLVTSNLLFQMTTATTVNGVPLASDKPAGEIEALSLATGKVEWDTKVASLPFGAATVSNDLVFTTLYSGELIALNRATGAIVYRQALPASTNAPIAVTGNTILVPAGAPGASPKGGSQLVAYSVP